MPLERLSDRAFICEPNGVRFVMREGGWTVLCVLTREALVNVFGSSDEAEWGNIFDCNPAVVEAVASDLYDAGETRVPVHVTSRDPDRSRLVSKANSSQRRGHLFQTVTALH